MLSLSRLGHQHTELLENHKRHCLELVGKRGHDYELYSSAAMTNNEGDKGFLCLTPLLQCKFCPETPLRRIQEITEVIILLSQSHQVAEKPILSIVPYIVLCSIVSKAFSKSSFRITISFFIAGIRECAQRPKQGRLLIKPYWFLWMRGIIAACSVSARIFVMSLRTELRSERGL